MGIFDFLKKLITPVKNPIEVSESVQKIDLPYQNEESILVSKNLLQSALNHYNKFKKLDFVVKPSLPVLYFGDLCAYTKSEFKIITAALNPSDAEFKEFRDSKPSFLRFPDYNKSVETLYLSLNEYFKNIPYKKWFGKPVIGNSGFLPILNGLETCYYDGIKKNTAIHTDICSPLATTPTWSKLSSVQQKELFKDGFELWKKLVLEIKPDLILMSLKKENLKLLPINFIKKIKSKRSNSSVGREQMEYVVEHYRLNLDGFETDLIWGSAQNTPFQPFMDKRTLGKEILEYISHFQKQSYIKKVPEIEQKIPSSMELKTYFKISKNWYGEGKKIRVEFNRGIHQHYSFLYDHDDVYEKTLNHLKSLSCWSNDEYYSSSTNIPSWAKDYIKQVNRYN